MLLIYVSKITPRIRYTLKTIFRTYLGFNDFELTADADQMNQHEGPKFSYTKKSLGKELHLQPADC